MKRMSKKCKFFRPGIHYTNWRNKYKTYSYVHVCVLCVSESVGRKVRISIHVSARSQLEESPHSFAKIDRDFVLEGRNSIFTSCCSSLDANSFFAIPYLIIVVLLELLLCYFCAAHLAIRFRVSFYFEPIIHM